MTTAAPGEKPRLRTVSARDLEGLLKEIERAKERFGLPGTARVVSCYEAGRDGFWLHRFLLSQGIENLVVDSSSIEVNRRARRAKTDRLDAQKLLSHLIRSTQGEKVFSVVRVPTPEQEDGADRQLGQVPGTARSPPAATPPPQALLQSTPASSISASL